jgi:hypothetical protein
MCYCKIIVGKIGREFCPSGIGIVVCVFLELEDKFVQSELLFLSSCVFLESKDKFVQLELLFLSSWNWKKNLSNWNC